jgi:DNA repair protein RadA/Sms
MAKIKTAYFCQNCGYESAKWLGKCPSCGQWNTFVEELIQKDVKKSSSNEWQSYNGDVVTKKTQPLHEVQTRSTPRI